MDAGVAQHRTQPEVAEEAPSPPGDVARPPGEVAALTRADVAALRHPTEPSRFALALVGMALPVAAAVFFYMLVGQATELLIIVVGIGAFLLAVWVGVQFWRIRLLADAVLVTERTLPEINAVLDSVRRRLGYRRRVDVFVVDRVSKVLSPSSAPIALTTFFGIHVLVVEGDTIGRLDSEQDRRRLGFALATHIGALRARYTQWWSPLMTAFQRTGLTVCVWPLLWPYYRAAVYSGDRFAYACCSEPDVSLEVVHRTLVGKEVATRLQPDGLTDQALRVRRHPLLRLAQLLRPTPHATNRYLELTSFIRDRSPQEYALRRAALGATPEAEKLFDRFAKRRQHRWPLVVGVAVSVVAIIAGAVLGTALKDVATRPTQAAFVDTSTAVGDDAQTLRLLSVVSTAVRPTCVAGGRPAGSGVATLACRASGGGPEQLVLVAFATREAMQDAFDGETAALGEGRCSRGGPAKGLWTRSGTSQGPLACYTVADGTPAVLWGYDEESVLVLAASTTMDGAELYTWWKRQRDLVL
jgi:hypothetical protein